MSLLANKISDAILKSSFSKSEIARRLGVSRPTVQAWATKGTITTENLRRLSSLLGISIDYFLTSDLSNENENFDPMKHKIKYLIDQIDDNDRVLLEIILKILS